MYVWTELQVGGLVTSQIDGERGRGCVLWQVHIHPLSRVICEIGRINQNRGWTASQ